MNNSITHTITHEDLVSAKKAIDNGIEYLRMCLADHEQKLGRSTLKNKVWAEQMESDLDEMLIIQSRLNFGAV